MIEKENTTYQNLWDKVKSLLTRKYIAVNEYTKKEESHFNSLSLHLEEINF